MKKIPQYMAVETLLSVLNPTHYINVIDRKNMYDNGETVYSGKAIEFLYGYKYAKYQRTKVSSIDILDTSTMVITIETCNDKY